jgi:hypothetical protein
VLITLRVLTPCILYSTVEVVKGVAPGKLSYKDSVIEAEEAWRALHRRRRKTGLVPRSTTRAAPPVTVTGASLVLSGEDDDVSFLPVTADPAAGDRGAESPESDTDDREGQVRVNNACSGFLASLSCCVEFRSGHTVSILKELGTLQLY